MTVTCTERPGLRQIFVDSGAWLAVYDQADQYHPSAIAFWNQLRAQTVQLVTSDYVLDETYTLLKLRASLRAAVALHRMLEASQIVTVVEINSSIFQVAWNLFESYTDKAWSFTDCTSLVIMRQLKLIEAFTFDEHFRQMGFVMRP
jgi:hypothetical protein